MIKITYVKLQNLMNKRQLLALHCTLTLNLSIPLMNNSRERIREEVDWGVASNDYGRMPKLHPILKSGIRAFRKRLAGFAT